MKEQNAALCRVAAGGRGAGVCGDQGICGEVSEIGLGMDGKSTKGGEGEEKIRRSPKTPGES